MPDPRSPRFGFGLGLTLLAIVIAWSVWPQGPAGDLAETAPRGEGNGTTARTEAEAERSERVRADITPEQIGSQPRIDGRPGGRAMGLFQLIDAETRAPLPDVLIAVQAANRFKAKVRTNAQGRFQLDDSAEVGSWDLELLQATSRFDRITPTAVWADPYEPVQVLYQRATSQLQLDVIGPTGLPVAGATIELARRPATQTTHYLRFESDEAGRLELPWPPAPGLSDGWLATAWFPGEGSCLPIEVPDQPDPTAQLRIQPGTRLELRVTDLTGNPFPHCGVRLRSLALSRNAFVGQLSASTGQLGGSPVYLDERGEAVWLQLPTGEYELSVRSPVGVGWQERTLHLTEPAESLVWQLEPPTEPVALEGQLLADPERRAPVPDHYVELTDAETGELIMGTRTNGDGRFRLFGASTGEVILNTHAMEGDHVFAPHAHRFPAGKTDVELIGESDRKRSVRLRILDQPTSIPLEGAFLERVDGDLTVRVGRSNAQGILAAELSPHARWQVRAPNHLRFPISLDSLPRVIRLQPGPAVRDSTAAGDGGQAPPPDPASANPIDR